MKRIRVDGRLFSRLWNRVPLSYLMLFRGQSLASTMPMPLDYREALPLSLMNYCLILQSRLELVLLVPIARWLLSIASIAVDSTPAWGICKSIRIRRYSLILAPGPGLYRIPPSRPKN